MSEFYFLANEYTNGFLTWHVAVDQFVIQLANGPQFKGLNPATDVTAWKLGTLTEGNAQYS